MRWAPFALTRVVVFFILGILANLYGLIPEMKEWIVLALVGSATIYLVLWLSLRKALFFRWNGLMGTTAFATFCLLGFWSVQLHDHTNYADHISHFSDVNAYKAVILDEGLPTEKTYRCLAEITAVNTSGQWESARGKAYLYFSHEISPPVYGDVYLISGRPLPVDPPMNPGEFDYRRFLAFQNIYHRHFIKTGAFKIDSAQGNLMMSTAYAIRSWGREQFDRYIAHDRERDIAKALVMGIRDGLNTEIKNAYSASGTMHILAVSGLHVGIIYLVISSLFKRLLYTVRGRWWFAGVCLFILWTYAVITGLSPSVLRAATMFSFVVVAKASNRNTNIYNTLAASALLLLIFNPFLVMSVGFQLSYSAVLGIVYLQPKIYGLWYFNNKLLDKLWELSAVSIAAQLATFPLGLLYFHQFPGAFLLANLVVVPTAFVVLILGFLLLFLSKLTIIADIIGDVLGKIIYLMNTFVMYIEKIPFSKIEGVYLNTMQAVLLMGLVLVLTQALIKRRSVPVYSCLIILLLLVGTIGYQSYVNMASQSLTFYRVSRHTLIDVIEGNRSVLYADSAFTQDSKKFTYHIRPNHLQQGVRYGEVSYLQPTEITGIKVLAGLSRRMAILEDVSTSVTFQHPVEVDYLVYTQSCKKDLKWIKDNFEFGLLLLDGSLYSRQADRLREEAEKLKIPYYSIFHDGAYQLKTHRTWNL